MKRWSLSLVPLFLAACNGTPTPISTSSTGNPFGGNSTGAFSTFSTSTGSTSTAGSSGGTGSGSTSSTAQGGTSGGSSSSANCVVGAACVPQNPCDTGVTDCEGGQAICQDLGASTAADGLSCGTGMVCSQGNCTSCTPGRGCVPANVCDLGSIDCSSGASVCTDTGVADPGTNGTACGNGEVCNAGACSACNQGGSCTPANVCDQGAFDCSSGSAVCADTGSPNPTADGTSCGSGVVCNGGACAACSAGASCAPANVCDQGTLDCGSGTPVCTDTGTANGSANGVACGSGSVCETGACVACDQGAGCTPTNVCDTGSIACGSGAPVCTDTGKANPQANGTLCGVGEVCHQGNCVACTAGGGCTPTNVCDIGTIACGTGTEVCTDSGQANPNADGVPCGQGKVCNSGSCVTQSGGSSTGAGSTGGTTTGSATGGGSTGHATSTGGSTGHGTSTGGSTGGSTSGGGSSGGSSSGGNLVTVTLTGCPLDYFYAPVNVGGQSFQMIFDTGSTDTGVAESTCSDCDVSPEYSAAAGSCSGSTSSAFGTGADSWDAQVCSAQVSVGGELPPVTIDFAGITSETGQFFNSFDCAENALSTPPTYQGILGMGPIDLDTIGTSADDAYFNELNANGIADVFSTLLCSNGGLAWFGGYDSAYASGAEQDTPLSMAEYWAVGLTSIGLGSTNLGGADAQAILDTGTQVFFMPTAAYDSVVTATNAGFTSVFGASTLGSAFNQSFCLPPQGGQTQAQIDAALPTMSLTFPNTSGGTFTLTYPATASYLVPVTVSGSTQYCLALADNAELDGLTIIGGSMLRANITVFNAGNGTAGFIPQSFCQ